MANLFLQWIIMGKETVLDSHIAELNSWLPHMKGRIVHPLGYTRLEEVAQWVRDACCASHSVLVRIPSSCVNSRVRLCVSITLALRGQRQAGRSWGLLATLPSLKGFG